MSDKRAKMFNKRAAKPKYKADNIIETLALQPGQTIADIGSGGGYYSLRFAKTVGKNGLVYAVDTNQDFLDFIQRQAMAQGMTNIRTILTSSEYPELPKHTCDLVFLRNVAHHLPNRVTYFRKLHEALKPTGKLVIIEYDGRGGFLSFQKLHHHFVPVKTLIEEMDQAGYAMQKQYDFLSEQSFTLWYPQRKKQ